ncbi:MAG: polyprenyl synthetase family protein [Streptococcaceae bacterium]|jgi:heptaprenyl diphosphate synthase|nr:polyprenyl synthetase family protein [Streptococcaceae bacterium]
MLDFWKNTKELETRLSAVQEIIAARLAIDDPEIQAALAVFLSKPGKMIRPALFLLFATWEKEISERELHIAASLELLHLATLIHDDIIDDSHTRRKQPTIQATLGKDVAVYAGDFIYTIYFEMLTETMAETPYLAKNAASMKRILNGELLQKANLYSQNQTVASYLSAISGKTAELLALACEEGAYFGALSPENIARAREIGRSIGLAFQIHDDVLNFSLDFANEKPILTDVAQGIYTLPLLLALENAPERVTPYLKTPSALTRAELIELAELVKSCGALEEAHAIAQELTDKALSELAKLPASSNQKNIEKAVKKLLVRTY